MSRKNFEIDQLEERIAPSSFDVGSLADGVLSGLDAGGALSGNHLLSNNDPSVSGNTVGALMGNTTSIGDVASGIQL